MNGVPSIPVYAVPTIDITMLGHFAVVVDGVAIDDRHWSRRHAAALVKVLAMAPDRRMHREQLIDLVWPEDTVEEAVPKLHKAAHFARRAIEVPNSLVLRGESVALFPDAETTVDVVGFEETAAIDIQRPGARDTVRHQFKFNAVELVPLVRSLASVDALNANTGGALSASERNALVAGLNGGSETRATVLLKVAENGLFTQREFNRAFVLMQYFGYLRRNPNAAPDADFSGYNFWLAKLNTFGGDFQKAEMVKAFIASSEYRGRFGPQ